MEHQHEPSRFKQAEFAAWIGIISNIILALLKFIIGHLGNSKALVADAVHSFSDVIGSLAVLIGLRAAKLPPDEEHPYGHGKAESIAAIIVAVVLFIVGAQIGYGSFQALFAPAVAPSIMAVYITIFSIILKETMFQYKYRLGKKLNSDALIANAWEHRSDAYSSVAALIGIGGAVLGGFLGIPWMVYLDPVAGIAVSIFVMIMAWKLGREAIHNTLDHVLPDDQIVELIRTAEQVDGVVKVDELFARVHGYYVIVDLKVAVDPHISVKEGHAIGKQVKEKLLEEHAHVHNVLVHINPAGEEQ